MTYLFKVHVYPIFSTLIVCSINGSISIIQFHTGVKVLWNDTSSVCLCVTDSYLNLQAETGIIKVVWAKHSETRRVPFSRTVMNNACMMGLKKMLMGL